MHDLCTISYSLSKVFLKTGRKGKRTSCLCRVQMERPSGRPRFHKTLSNTSPRNLSLLRTLRVDEPTIISGNLSLQIARGLRALPAKLFPFLVAIQNLPISACKSGCQNLSTSFPGPYVSLCTCKVTAGTRLCMQN